jgi:hypothetical protein
VRIVAAAFFDVAQDRVDDHRVGDHRHDLHLHLALRTQQRIDFEDLAQQARPAPAALACKLRFAIGLGVGLRPPGPPTVRLFRGGTIHVAHSVGIGPVVAHEVLARIGDLLGQAVDQLERVEGQLRRAGRRVGLSRTGTQQTRRCGAQGHPRQRPAPREGPLPGTRHRDGGAHHDGRRAAEGGREADFVLGPA